MSTSRSEINLAFLLLQSSELPPVHSLFSYFAKHWPEAECPDKFDGEQKVVMFESKSMRGFVATMDIPIPDILPPDSEKQNHETERDRLAREHKAHAIVGIYSENPRNPVDRAVCLTRWVASIGHSCNALGVYWGAGDAVCSRQAFEEQAELMSEEYLPIPLWVSCSAMRQKDGSVLLSTNGLSTLGMWEVEAVSSMHEPAFLYPYAYGLACYILTGGRVGDGETFGFDENDRILVRHNQRGWCKKVYRLDFDAAKKVSSA